MAAASSSSGAGTQPNTSLYIKNLNTKTKKPELRRQLYALFSTYGKVIDVVATRVDGMRGQAFVVFGDLRSATAARRALDGFEFYEKSIKIEYARSRSKATVILEDGPEALFDPSRLASPGGTTSGTAVGKAGKVTFSSAQADQRGRERKRAREEARQRGERVDEEEESGEEGDGERGEEDEDAEEGRESKVRKVDDGDKEDGAPAAKGEDSDEDDAAMDMADSDSDADDDDTPGPPAPPPAS